jgi:hypothetical protein
MVEEARSHSAMAGEDMGVQGKEAEAPVGNASHEEVLGNARPDMGGDA